MDGTGLQNLLLTRGDVGSASGQWADARLVGSGGRRTQEVNRGALSVESRIGRRVVDCGRGLGRVWCGAEEVQWGGCDGKGGRGRLVINVPTGRVRGAAGDAGHECHRATYQGYRV